VYNRRGRPFAVVMSINIAVVPVAGLGTRLLPATKSQPKEMLPVGRKPVVQYVVDELTRSNMRRLLFVTGNGKESIENFFDVNHELIRFLRETGREELLATLEFERRPVEYAYTRQREQLGLGHAILCAEPFVTDQSFVVALGDSIIGLHADSNIVQRMVHEFERTKAGLQHSAHLYEGEGKFLGVQLAELLKKHEAVLQASVARPATAEFTFAGHRIEEMYAHRVVGF